MPTSNQIYATLTKEDQANIDKLFSYPRLQRAMNAIYDTVFAPFNRMMAYFESSNTKTMIAEFEASEARRAARIAKASEQS
jgi:hypothetical protein